MDTFAETAIVDYVYRLPTKENKRPFPFPFAANKWKFSFLYTLKFSVLFYFETAKCGECGTIDI
jgi:hypothetical protein